jgi:hypothetical protein
LLRSLAAEGTGTEVTHCGVVADGPVAGVVIAVFGFEFVDL